MDSSIKTSISCETSYNFDILTHRTTKGAAASPIDTAKPETPDETCWSVKTSILCKSSCNFDKLELKNRRCPQEAENLQPQNRCFVRGFRQIHHISHNATPATQFALCHHFEQPCQCDSQKTRKTTRLKCCTCHEKCNACHENIAKVLQAQNNFRHVTKHVHM